MNRFILFVLIISIFTLNTDATVFLTQETCYQGSDCDLNSLTVDNLTVYGDYVNISVINYNVTGDIVAGGVNSSHFNISNNDGWVLFNGNLLEFNTSKLSTTYYNKTQTNQTIDTYLGFPNRSIISYHNISDLPTCSGTDKLTFDGNTLTCDTDVANNGSAGQIGGTTVYVGNSMTKKVYWNISKAEANGYRFRVIDGGKLFPIGGELI